MKYLLFLVFFFCSFFSAFSSERNTKVIWEQFNQLFNTNHYAESDSIADLLYDPNASDEDNMLFYLAKTWTSTVLQDTVQAKLYLGRIDRVLSSDNNLQEEDYFLFDMSTCMYSFMQGDFATTLSKVNRLIKCIDLIPELKENPNIYTWYGLRAFVSDVLNKEDAIDNILEAKMVIESNCLFQLPIYPTVLSLWAKYYAPVDILQTIRTLDESISKISPSVENYRNLCTLCYELSSLYESVYDFENSQRIIGLVESYENALSANQIENADIYCFLLPDKIVLLRQMYDAKRYMDAQKLGLSIVDNYGLELNNNPSWSINVQYMIGASSLCIGDLNRADLYLQNTLEMILNNKDMYDVDGYLESTLFSLGELSNKLSDYQRAIYYFDIIRNKHEKDLDFGESYIQSLIALSESYDGLYLINKSTDYRLLAKDYCDTSKKLLLNSNLTGTAFSLILTKVSNVYYHLGDFDNAIECSSLAWNVAINNCDQEMQQYVLAEHALKIGKLQGYDKAWSLYRSLPSNYQNDRIGLHLRYLNGDRFLAEIAAANAIDLRENAISILSFLSNEERTYYWDNWKDVLNIYNKYIYDSNAPRYYGEIYNNALFTKGLELRIESRTPQIIQNIKNDEIDSLIQTTIEQRLLVISNKLSSDSIAKTRLQLKENERKLARLVEVDSMRNLFQTWEQVRDRLEPDETAIEFISMPEYQKDSIFEGRYYALILKRDAGNPVIVPLCYENQIAQFPLQSDSIYHFIWSPIERFVSDSKRIYYSPYGKLHQIPLEAILVDNKFLFEKYDLRLVSSTENIHQLKKSSFPSSACIYGGIQYDTDINTMSKNAMQYYEQSVNSDIYSLDSTRKGFNYLPSSQKEADIVEEILSAKNVKYIRFSGADASEDSFKSLSSRAQELIHIATHGFYIQDYYSAKERIGFADLFDEYSSYLNSLMYRCGLMFSGCNHVWLNEEQKPLGNDGILTAAEVAVMDLADCDLVVLSACQTALGIIKDSEGVYGLQRAFKMAGVKSIIMSLWEISDEATMYFMTSFYSHWANGMELHDAFNIAKKEMKDTFEDPYYWASFVLLD